MTKRITSFLLAIFIILTLFSGISSANSTEDDMKARTVRSYPGTTVTIMKGDILVTNNTISSGLTGHAGIVINDSGDVASIAGYWLSSGNSIDWCLV